MTLQPFKYIAADSLAEAETLLRQYNGKAALVAGGTDLLGALKDAIHPDYPEVVIGLKPVRNLSYVDFSGQGLRLGALTTLDEIAEHPDVRAHYPMLAEAAHSVASSQIRNVATLAGNLCQEPRCWYYRNPDNTFDCLRKGGSRCNALFGENRYHSIFGATQVDAAPCAAACPIRTDIPAYMTLIREGNVAAAAQLLLDCNPLAAVTGRVCPHFCEEECNRADSDTAVSIREVERFLGDYLLDRAADYYIAPIAKTGASVGVVGAGPAGLAAAYFLRQAGHDVTVYDRMPEAGGMLTYSIPAYRLPKEVVRKQVAALAGMGIRFELGACLGAEGYTLPDLRQKHDRVLLAVGLWRSKSLKIEDGDLLESGLAFLIQVQQGARPAVGRRVVVIGGGSVAVDVAITARRLGAEEVTMAFLESRATMPALLDDIEQANAEGIKMLPSYGPLRVLKQDGKLAGMELMRCSSVFDDEGHFAPCFDADDCATVEADQVLYAIGQVADLAGIDGHVTAPRNLIDADRATQATSMTGVYAAGDVTRGPATVVNAIAEGRRAAAAIDAGLAVRPREAAGARSASLMLNTTAFQPLHRNQAPQLPVELRTLLTDDGETLPLNAVEQEAQRCANCGCVAVNASDIAPALVALDASIKTTHRTLSAEELFAAVKRKTTALEATELIEEITIPALPHGTKQGYLKFRLRNAVDFPIVSLAYRWESREGKLHRARLVFGAVAPVPLRSRQAEALLEAQAPSEELARQVGSTVAAEAQPLADNKHKVAVLQALLRKAILAG